MRKRTVSNQGHGTWSKAPLATAIEGTTSQGQRDLSNNPVFAAKEREAKLNAAKEGSNNRITGRHHEGAHYRSTPGSDEGEGDVDATLPLAVETGLNDLVFTPQETDDPRHCPKGQLVAALQVVVDGRTAGVVGNRAYCRRKRFRKAPNPPDKPLLTDEEAAYVLDVEPDSLPVFRSTGRHQIPFIKIGRNVRYRRADLEAWLQSHTHATGVTSKEEA